MKNKKPPQNPQQKIGWTVVLWNAVTGDQRTYENVVNDGIVLNGEGQPTPIRFIDCADGARLEYPMASFIAFFSPEREMHMRGGKPQLEVKK